MKKGIIATIVGTLILYLWSFLSWAFLPIHMHSFKYTPHQQKILQTLDKKIESSGAYIMPMADNRDVGYYSDEYQKARQQVNQKHARDPFAMIIYNKSGFGQMTSSFIIGFLLQLISVLIAVVFLSVARSSLHSFYQRWWFIMLIPLLVSLGGPLSDWNWMHFPWHYIKGMVFDLGVSWALCGLWLAYYLK